MYDSVCVCVCYVLLLQLESNTLLFPQCEFVHLFRSFARAFAAYLHGKYHQINFPLYITRKYTAAQVLVCICKISTNLRINAKEMNRCVCVNHPNSLTQIKTTIYTLTAHIHRVHLALACQIFVYSPVLFDTSHQIWWFCTRIYRTQTLTWAHRNISCVAWPTPIETVFRVNEREQVSEQEWKSEKAELNWRFVRNLHYSYYTLSEQLSVSMYCLLIQQQQNI